MLEKHLKAAWEKLDAGDLEGARKHVEAFARIASGRHDSKAVSS